jgi:putative peptidoglycan lipid II flippase
MASPSSEKESSASGSRVVSKQDEPTQDTAGHSVIARSAGTVSFAVMLSRVLGLVREQVLAFLFPARTSLDAFYAAFRLPNLLRDMFGEGALSKAFVTTFAEIQEKEGEQAAMRLANLVVNALVLVVGALVLLGIFYADVLVDAFFGGRGFDIPLPAAESFGFETKRQLTIALTRIMFPFILLVSVAAMVMGVLNARGRFFIPALASAFFNVGSVVVGVSGYFLAPRFGQHPAVGMAVGVLAGGVLQLLWQLPLLIRLGYRYLPLFHFRDPWLWKVFRLFGPGALIASTVQVNLLVNSIFASRGVGWLTWIMQAFRILHLPIGLVGVAISTATLPTLSRAAANQDYVRFRETFSYAVRLVILFTVPATVGLLVLATPIVRLIFEQGRFGPNDTIQVAAALRYYTAGLISFAAVKIVTDGFYAIQQIHAPLVISILSMLSNYALNWLFIVQFGMDQRGLAAATSGTTTISCICLWLLFRKRSRLGRLDGRRTLVTFVKCATASALMGALAFVAFRGLDQAFGHDALWARLVQVGTTIVLALLTYGLMCKLLRVRELNQALAAVLPQRLRWR